MTKTLTEQWKNGELKDGSFYIERLGKYMRANCIGTVLYLENHDVIWSPNTVEILAPVPSYEEYEDIIQQNVNQESAIETYIEQIKQIQEQLKEANNIIVKADWDCDYGLQEKCGFSEYLKKYNIEGVK